MGKAGCELEETGGNEKDFIKLKNMLLKGSQAIAKPQPVLPCRNGVLVNLDVYMKSPKFPLLAKLFFFFFNNFIHNRWDMSLDRNWPKDH